jgi:hypothetical protein
MFLRCESLEPPMSQMGLVSRVTPVHTALRNCTRDEGRPFEVGNQVLISSPRKLLSSERWPIACAMQHGVLLWVKSFGSTRPTSSRHVRCASDSSPNWCVAPVRRLVPKPDSCGAAKPNHLMIDRRSIRQSGFMETARPPGEIL